MGCQNLVVIAGYKETLNALKNNHFQSRHRTINQTFRVFYKVLGEYKIINRKVFEFTKR